MIGLSSSAIASLAKAVSWLAWRRIHQPSVSLRNAWSSISVGGNGDKGARAHLASEAINNFVLACAVSGPDGEQAPGVACANTVLFGAISAQGFEPIAPLRAHVIQYDSLVRLYWCSPRRLGPANGDRTGNCLGWAVASGGLYLP